MEKISIDVWVTTIDQKKLLEKQEKVNFKAKVENTEYIINIDENKTYQQMDGFGASLTDASAWLIYNTLSEENCMKLMNQIFDKNKGIGMSFIRQPIGASDYALNVYSYDDVQKGETDFKLEKFSIDHDKRYIIPLIKEAMDINKDIKIMATPWSPPGWMKTSDNMIGGILKLDCYDSYAKYFTRFIQEYKKQGITIYAISPQNEPLFNPEKYPGMIMKPEEQLNFIKNNLGPAFKINGIDTKIMCYDHNWDMESYPLLIFSDVEASKFIAGSAWHYYGGAHEVGTNDIASPGYTLEGLISNYRDILTQVKERLPDSSVYVMAYYPVNSVVDYGIPLEDKQDMFKTRTNEVILKANKAIEQLARQFNYEYIDVNQGLMDEEGNLKADFAIEGLHMWPQAYAIIFKNLIQYL